MRRLAPNKQTNKILFLDKKDNPFPNKINFSSDNCLFDRFKTVFLPLVICFVLFFALFHAFLLLHLTNCCALRFVELFSLAVARYLGLFVEFCTGSHCSVLSSLLTWPSVLLPLHMIYLRPGSHVFCWLVLRAGFLFVLLLFSCLMLWFC